MWDSASNAWRRFNDWLGYGALGPILLLMGLGSIWNALYAVRFHPLVTNSSVSASGDLSAIACTVSGLFTAGVGLIFIIRPRTQWWAAIVGSSPTAVANISLGYTVYGPQKPELYLDLLVFPLVVVGVAWYAHHCHRPVLGIAPSPRA